MYLAQEMYDLVTCTIFHMKWHPSLAKAGHDKSLTCYDTPTKYVVLVHFCFDNSKSPYGFGMESGPTRR